MILIERDNFRKMGSYTEYEKCLEEVNQNDLENLSKNPKNEDTYMNFLRYISLLS